MSAWLMSSWCDSASGGVVRLGRGGVRVGAGCLGELLGKALVFGTCGVEVGLCAFGADAQGIAGLFEGGDAGAGGGGELVECALVVCADAGGLVGCGGLDVLGACVVALGLGVPAALDLFGKACLGGGNALLGAGAGGVHLGFG